MSVKLTKKHLLLFDIDGTLTKSRLKIEQPMIECLNKARKYFDLGIVGGSDRVKQIEQLGDMAYWFDWAFSENGTLSFKENEEIHRNSIANFLGEDKLQRLIHFCLQLVIETQVPIKRGTFLEYRNGLINLSIIGRNCTQEERLGFVEFDKQHNVLNTVAEKIREKFDSEGIYVSVGGQISIDIFPKGWDKTYCLQFVDSLYEDIHFFGDKCMPGGNDYELYGHKRVTGHWGKNGPDDTISEVEKLIKQYGYE